MKFKELTIGQVFTFVGTGYGPCKKISARKYVDEPDNRAERAAELGRIYNIRNYAIEPFTASINAEVRI